LAEIFLTSVSANTG